MQVKILHHAAYITSVLVKAGKALRYALCNDMCKSFSQSLVHTSSDPYQSRLKMFIGFPHCIRVAFTRLAKFLEDDARDNAFHSQHDGDRCPGGHLVEQPCSTRLQSIGGTLGRIYQEGF